MPFAKPYCFAVVSLYRVGIYMHLTGEFARTARLLHNVLASCRFWFAPSYKAPGCAVML
jgi:hypothetical protein